MTAPTRLHLKQQTGWFAAGREVDLALKLLSDSAFRLFMWLCLHADRSCGAICVKPSEMASSLCRTEEEIHQAINELLQQNICNRHGDDVIEIADRFWPYQRLRCYHPGNARAAYITEVKRIFLERRCVRSTFTTADEKLAVQLHRNGVSITDVEHAILLGSLRKYVALVNNGGGTPITSLHYFTALFDEVRKQVPTDYWTYIAHKIRTLEARWAGFKTTPETETK